MLLGLDIGTKRTGVAIANSIIATELTTIAATGDELARQLKQICQTEMIDKIVIGLPLSSDGQLSDQAQYVQMIARHIGQVVELPIVYVDEYLTTQEAARVLEENGLDDDEIEKRIDQRSAAIILQQYINEQHDETSTDS